MKQKKQSPIAIDHHEARRHRSVKPRRAVPVSRLPIPICQRCTLRRSGREIRVRFLKRLQHGSDLVLHRARELFRLLRWRSVLSAECGTEISECLRELGLEGLC